MLVKKVKYTDYDGEEQIATLHFNLNKFEWLELETFTNGGLLKNLKTAIETDNAKKTINLLKKIILTAYGEKDDDSNFVKSDDRAIRFSQTEAFSNLFYELAYDGEKSQEFFIGLIPSELRQKAIEQMNNPENKRLGLAAFADVSLQTPENLDPQ